MAELTISSDEVRSAIDNYVSSYSPDVNREEVGLVVDTGDGVAHVEGLPSTMANELLEFPGGILGVAQNLEPRRIGVVILGNYEQIEEGQEVKRTGRILSVPVGDAFLGRVVDPLGMPLDGLWPMPIGSGIGSGSFRSSFIVPPFLGGGMPPAGMACGTMPTLFSSTNRIISDPHCTTSAWPSACFWIRMLLR